MGCHTWFYKKVDVNYEEVKAEVIYHYEEEISLLDKMINDRESLDKDILDAYPEFTIEYGLKNKPIAERKLSIIRKNLCKEAVCRRYRHDDKLTDYVTGKGFYITTDDLYHDLFRIGNYPVDKLFSLEETLDFIEKNKDKIHSFYFNKIQNKDFKQQLEDFWQKYPDGMIDFG